MKRLILLLGFIALACSSAIVTGQNIRTVSVIGEGTATVPADLSMITVTVQSRADNATVASSMIDAKLNETIDALVAAGVKRDEILPIQASSVSSITSSSKNCWKENNTTVCKDVTTSELGKSITINLKTTDQAILDNIREASNSTGANAYVEYGLSDSTKATADARKKAVENARINAQDMAAAAGARLGEVLNIYGSGFPYIAKSKEPGMVDVKYNIEAIYELMA
ncbi:MAG: SIMPL domain-containing protein [Methanotrichaceae archaeon]|nr:SIMPL domain-containing protein [Methanotrichaceae archaeon]